MKIAVVAAALLIYGCSAPKLVSLPNGQTGYAVVCSGTRSSQADCMNKAAEVCGGPYTIVSQNESAVGGVAVTPTVYGVAIRRNMVVSCND